MIYEEINKRTWNAAKNYFLDLINDSSFWVFRGQENTNWTLKTTIERILNYDNQIKPTIEYELFNEFKRAAHNYLNTIQIPETAIYDGPGY